MMFLSFLFIYSLFLMTELRPHIIAVANSTDCDYRSQDVCCKTDTSFHIGYLEGATYCFVFANFLEEVRQVCVKLS